VDFNEYRARYADLTDEEHRAAYAEWFRLYPSQKCCTLDALRRFLRDGTDGCAVLEIGGWDGWAAREMLVERPRLASWTNHEVCREAALASQVPDGRYRAYVPGSFRWWRDVSPWSHSFVVASHVIEHLSNDDARELLSTLKPRAWYIEAPIAEHGQDWHDYNGSHVLTAGWREVESWLRDAGYERAWEMGDARSFVRAR
jgi:hypothetical protein